MLEQTNSSITDKEFNEWLKKEYPELCTPFIRYYDESWTDYQVLCAIKKAFEIGKKLNIK